MTKMIFTPNHWLTMLAVAALAFGGTASGEEGNAPEDNRLIGGLEQSLTTQDVQAILALIPPDRKAGIYTNRAKLHEMLWTTYMTKVAAHRAEQKGLDQLPAVRHALENAVRNTLAKADVDDQIAKITEQDLEQAARDYYQAYGDRYTIPAKADVSYLRIETQEGSEASLEQVVAALAEGAHPFEQVCEPFHQPLGRPAEEKPCELGWVTEAVLPEPYAQAIFSAETTGELQGPIDLGDETVFIRVNERKAAEKRPFEDVAEGIKARLRDSYRKKIREEYWIQIKNDPLLTVNEELLSEILDNPAEFE